MANERIFEYIWIAVFIARGFSTKRHAINAEAFDSGTIALQCERLSASFLGHPFACLPRQEVVVVVVVVVVVLVGGSSSSSSSDSCSIDSRSRSY